MHYELSYPQMLLLRDLVQHYGEWISYLDFCSSGKTPDMVKALDAMVSDAKSMMIVLNSANKVVP